MGLDQGGKVHAAGQEAQVDPEVEEGRDEADQEESHLVGADDPEDIGVAEGAQPQVLDHPVDEDEQADEPDADAGDDDEDGFDPR